MEMSFYEITVTSRLKIAGKTVNIFCIILWFFVLQETPYRPS